MIQIAETHNLMNCERCRGYAWGPHQLTLGVVRRSQFGGVYGYHHPSCALVRDYSSRQAPLRPGAELQRDWFTSTVKR